MKRFSKFIIFSLSMMVLGTGIEVKASESVEDKNIWHPEVVTAVDEYGDVYEVEVGNGTVYADGESADSMSVYSRTTPVKVVNFNTKGYDVTNYTEYLTGAVGYTCGACGADAAYLGTYNGKVRFMLSGVVGEVAESEVEIVNLADAKVISCYVVSNGRLNHKLVFDMTTPGYAATLDNGEAPSYLKTGINYYSYDGHYFYTDYEVMLADYCNNSRENSVNPKTPYYNYYQFLSFRSESGYTAAEINSMIAARTTTRPNSKMIGLGEAILNGQKTYGVNALAITAIAANESGWGTSSISQEKNNLFGINAVDGNAAASANAFESPAECVRQFSETYMSKRYLRPGYTYGNGSFIGNKASGINVRYGSDPYWGEKAANIMYALDKSGGNKDQNKYLIGIKDTISTVHNNVAVKKDSNATSTTLYQTGSVSNYAVIIREQTAEDGFYKIQSDAVLNSGRTAVDTSTGNYSYENMYAYIPVSSIYVTNTVQEPIIPTPTEYTVYEVTGSNINYRSGPGTSYEKKGQLNKGELIYVENGYSQDANGYTWYRFVLNGGTYYVASKYLKKVENVTADMNFTDVKTSDWYYEFVKYVYDNKLMVGMNEDSFGAQTVLTRAQFVTILHRIAGLPDAKGTIKFTDVKAGDWYTNAVAWAAETGIVSGYSDTIFGTNDPLKREQMVAMMYRYAKYTGRDTSKTSSYDKFGDADKVSSYAVEAMKWAVGSGLINGRGTVLDPQGSMTRAECATVISKYMKN